MTTTTTAAPSVKLELPLFALPYLQSEGADPGIMTPGQVEILEKLLQRKAQGYTFAGADESRRTTQYHDLRTYSDADTPEGDQVAWFHFTLKPVTQ